MTERLYYTDSHLTEFEARVLLIGPRTSGWATVTLDRTAFHPTGGGQPTDTGTLAGSRVVECVEDDDEEGSVLHVIHGPVPEVGAMVVGHVDWQRRLDHIQQHTGQHLLSQAFVELFKAETRGFRMMDEASEIDVNLDNPTDGRVERAIDLANRIIWEDRPVRVLDVTAEEAAGLSLRKEPSREGGLRLIEIEGFDLTPCGGTHAYRTGEVGLIAVRSWERAKGMTRIEFVAGQRALADYRRANQTAREVAAQFSIGRDEGAAAVARLFDENKELARHVRKLEATTAQVEAEELFNGVTPSDDGVRIVSCIFDGRDAESLKRLAVAIIAHPQTIALVASRDPDAARLVFARSKDVSGDMNSLMIEACEMLGGHGGGRPEMAQGGGRLVEKLDDAIQMAVKKSTPQKSL